MSEKIHWVGTGVLLATLFVALGACSSRSQTTILSFNQNEDSEVVIQKGSELESKVLVDEAGMGRLTDTSSGIPAIDSSVEPSPRGVTPDGTSQDIFTLSAEEAVDDVVILAPKSPENLGAAPSLDRPEKMDLANSQRSSLQQRTEGIPPIQIDPELPTLPTIRKIDNALLSEKNDKAHQQEIPLIKQDMPNQNMESDSGQVPIVSLEELSLDEEPIIVAKLAPNRPDISVVEGAESLGKVLTDVYFDYDRFTLRDDASSKLERHAETLLSHLSDQTIVIEGHCDERGTASYNMVLGERRARSIKNFLVDLGVPAEKLKAISYGKEKPLCTQQIQSCWQENRRGHFVVH